MGKITTSARYDRTIKFLFDLEFFGIKLGLKNINSLLDYCGNPENNFPSVHIAGTNGKGSTAAMIASVLTASGYKTGLYTSPHLVDFAERIRIDGRKISWDDIIAYANYFKSKIIKQKATFFEATTAIAFKYFAEQKIDIAVVETGLGGRWDATNVLSPLVSVITNINIEHEQYLGKTYSSVAREKGGIIKPYIPSFTATKNPEALKKLRSIAKSNQSKLYHIDENSKAVLISNSLTGIKTDIYTSDNIYPELKISLVGVHQLINSRLSILVLEYLKKSGNFRLITKNSIYNGFEFIKKYTGLFGRMDMISISPLIIGDVAHNPDAVKKLVESIRKLIHGKVVLLFGVMKDKRFTEMIEYLQPITRVAVAVQPKGLRSLDKSILIDCFNKLGIPAVKGKTCEEGLRLGLVEKRENEPILITGSHYVLSEILQNINKFI
ncbi:MAG: bifunctional folylpolyglutamate synthase/dihydrofolate synthase [Ignavibacteriales bacterium]|nr:bifunctional folylpolyglutamate synthase/dihydrofolate synthase [Ignavibacteriales bacterium]